MADITLKNLGDLPVVDPNESTHLLAEQNGAYARVPKDKVGGGVTSWNDLTDKPFGEEKVVIEWDGVIGDRAVATAGDMFLWVKVSDMTSVDAIIGGTTCFVTDVDGLELPENVEITEKSLTTLDGGVLVLAGFGDLMIAVVTQENAKLASMTFPETGLYFPKMTMDGQFVRVSRLECSTVKTIDPKFIPSVGGAALTVTFSTDVENMTITADKSFAEIREAVENGVRVVGRMPVDMTALGLEGYSCEQYTLSSIMVSEDLTAAYFVGGILKTSAMPCAKVNQIEMLEDDTCTQTTIELAPYAS